MNRCTYKFAVKYSHCQCIRFDSLVVYNAGHIDLSCLVPVGVKEYRMLEVGLALFLSYCTAFYPIN